MSSGLILALDILIYFGKDGDRLVILLAGGTKKRQNADIAAAKGHWRDYKRRKRQEVT
jgi:putative component of toxin-antitoxin plasmid stabilization module